MSTDENIDQSQSQSQVGMSTPGLSLTRVIKLISIPLILFVLIVAGITFGWEDALNRFRQPRLVTVTGEVQYQGKPMTVGYVSTRYLDGRGGTTLGPLDSDGRFSLSTNGMPGAFVGRHKVLVMCFDSSVFPPRSIIPEKYAQEAVTPFAINVTSSEEKNHFSFKVEDQ